MARATFWPKPLRKTPIWSAACAPICKERATCIAKVVDGKQEAGAKFSDYFDHTERWATTPSHRALAMLRGRNEDVLTIDIEIDADDTAPVKPVEQHDCRRLRDTARMPGPRDSGCWRSRGWTWRVKLSLALSLDLMRELRERAEEEAIQVFARNLKDLLLAAPAGSRATMGLDPGIRTGVKVAVVDDTGKLLETATVYPFQPKNDVRGAQAEIGALIAQHKVELIAIGNGTASRETEKLVADLLAELPRAEADQGGRAARPVRRSIRPRDLPPPNSRVSTCRCAARCRSRVACRTRWPNSSRSSRNRSASGQYQHDVDQYRLAARWTRWWKTPSTRSASISTPRRRRCWRGCRASARRSPRRLSRIATRSAPSGTASELLKVARLGPRTFEQCAGFLRIPNGEEPLDASSVHPEAYGVASKIVAACGRDVRALMGDSAALKALDPRAFVDERFGLPTVRDILAELEKPGRDPRPSFKTATFADGVERDQRSEARHAAGRHRDQRRRLRRLRRYRRPSGRAGSCLPAGRPLREGPA